MEAAARVAAATPTGSRRGTRERRGKPPGVFVVNGGRSRRLDGRPPTTPKSNGVGRHHRGGGGGGEHSGGSGSSSGDEGRGYAGSFRAASPFEASLVASGAIEVGGVNRLEGRLNLLSQRVDDLAQAYNRAQGRDRRPEERRTSAR